MTKINRQLNKLSYDDQSAALKSLFNDLDTDAARADLETIGATEWLKELKADHEAFEAGYQQRNIEKSTRDIPTDLEARKLLASALDDLITVINAFKLSSQLENVDRTIALLNGTIDRARIAANRGRRLDEPESDTNAD